MNAAEHKASHVWSKPMAGQGTERVCKNCGVRFSQAGKDSECGDLGVDGPIETQAEYDPI